MTDGKGDKFLGDLYCVPDKAFLLEDDPNECYCYSAVFCDKDYLLCAYYHSYGTDFPLSAGVIKKVMLSELDALPEKA